MYCISEQDITVTDLFKVCSYSKTVKGEIVRIGTGITESSRFSI